MKQRLLVALLTVLVFAAGFATHAWTEEARAVPAPSKLGGEFAPKSIGLDAKKPVNRDELIGEIERNRAQSEAYRAKVGAFDQEFEQGFRQMLWGDQCTIYAARPKAHEAHQPKLPLTLSDDDIDRLRRIPLYGMLNSLAVSSSLDGLTKVYSLDAEQQARTRQLLNSRRDKLVDLLEQTPPPSVRLSFLAPVVQNLAAPKDGR